MSYQNSPSSLKVNPSFSRSFSDIFVHSGDLERSRVNEEQEYRYAWVMLSLGGRILFLDEEFPILPLLPFPMLPLRIIEEAGCIGSLIQSDWDKMTGKKKRRQINNN